MNPNVVFSVAPTIRQSKDEQLITAVIGKNGTGKSHLLTSIVQTFLAVEEIKRDQESRHITVVNLPLSYLSYLLNGQMCIIERTARRKYRFLIDGREVLIQSMPLPGRIIALTISPFDKFPVPRSKPHSVAPAFSSSYRYLGLRDQFNKSSLENLLYRSLNALFEESENEALRRINIGAIFEYLNLQAHLTVIYRLRIPIAVRSALSNGQKVDFSRVSHDYVQQRRVNELIQGGVSEDELAHLLHIAVVRAYRGVIRTTAEFSQGGALDEMFRTLQPLRRAGFLRLSGVEVTQQNGLISDLKRASSGQLSMVAALLSLASAIVNGSLVLIDEPELSLHPEWQIDYVNLLTRTFSRFEGCHFVIATHSPMVISELPANAQVIALDRTDVPSVNEIAGQSADYLLAEVFGTPTHGNLYVRERLVNAMRLIASGRANSVEFAEALVDLQKLARDMGADDPVRETIGNLEEVARQAGAEAR